MKTTQAGPLRRVVQIVVQIAALATAYYGTGKLGLLLAIPPGYATALWPPSGIALAALLTSGPRIWPGILIGSFCINVATSFDSSSAFAIAQSLSVAIGIGLGASLQALCGAWLIRRFVGFPLELIRENDVARFVVLGGPVSCLLNATVSVSMLALAGIVQWSQFTFTWWTWWVGDTIGVVVVTPMCLPWLAEPRVVWRRRRLALVLPQALMFTLVVFFFVRASGWEQTRIQLEFRARATTLVSAVTKKFDEVVESLHATASLLSAVPEVNREAFRTFVKRSLGNYPGIQALSWNPRVVDADRDAFEARAGREVSPAFRITEESASGALLPAGRRAEHVTVLYIEPPQGNEVARGFDVASDAARREALAQAGRTGQPTATGRVRLVQEHGQQAGIVIFLPVYRSAPGDPAPGAVRGFVAGALRLDDTMAAAVAGLPRDGVELSVLDGETIRGPAQLLWTSDVTASEIRERAGGLMTVSHVSVAGRRWSIICHSSPAYDALVRSWQPWAVLAGGLVFTGLLGAFLLVVTGRPVMVERFGAQRGAELSGANAILEAEVAERKQARSEAERRQREAEQLARLAQTLIQSVDPRVISQRVVEQVPGLFDVGYCVVRLLQPDGALLALAASGSQRGPFAPGHVLPAGLGLPARAVAERRPVWTPDILQEPGVSRSETLRQGIEAAGIRAMLIVPLRSKDQVIGVLSLGDARSRAFSPEEIDLLQAFGDQLALALENARHVEEAEQRLRRTETLLSISETVGSTLDRTEILRRIARHACQVLHADMAGAYLVDPDDGTLRPLAGYHVPESLVDRFRSTSMPVQGHPFIQEAWRDRRPVWTSQADQDGRILRSLLDAFPLRSLLFVPMFVEDRPIGGLAFVWWETSRAFEVEELRLLEGISREAATAVQRARLFGEAERRRGAAERLAEIARVVSQSLDPKGVAERIVVGLGELLNVQTVGLYRLVPETGDLVSIALVLPESARPMFGETVTFPAGTGVAGRAVQSRQPVVTTDLLSDPSVTLHDDMRAQIERGSYRAVLAVPLLVREQVIGALAVGDRLGRRFEPEDVQLVQTFADQAAVALDNARLYETTRGRAQQLTTLAEVTRTVTRLLDAETLAKELLVAMQQLIPDSAIQFWRWVEDEAVLRPVANLGLRDPAGPLNQLRPGEGIAGLAAETRHVVLVPDVQADPRFANRAWAAREGLVAAIAVPLAHGDRLYGVLAIGSRTPGAFSEEHVQLLSSFAAQAAIALENARLYDALEGRASRLRTLARLNALVSSSLDLEAVLNEIARAAAALTGAPSANFWLADEASQTLELRAFPFEVYARDFPLKQSRFGEGFIGWVAAHRQRLHVPDVFADARDRLPEWGWRHGFLSFLGVPILLDGSLLAVLSLDSPKPFRLEAGELELLDAFVAQAGLAIRNARLYAGSEARRRAAEALAHVGRTLTETLDVDLAATRIADRLRELFAADFALVQRLDPSGDLVVLATSRSGTAGEEVFSAVPRETGVRWVAIRERRPVISLDPLLDPRVTLTPDQRSDLERTAARATLAVPLLAQGRVLGVLVVRAARPFDDPATELAQAFADQAVVALESARLYQETTRAYEELARTQAQLVQSQKMEAMGRLAGGVAHDFNNLLTVILGRSELLLSRAEPGSDLERQQRLIREAALQAGRLTQQLLAFSRKQVLQPRVMDLHELAVGMRPMLRRLIGEDVDLTVVRGDGVGRVQADPSQLEQVILNLVVNARDAMPDGGRLTIEVAKTTLDAVYTAEHVGVRPGPYVMLAVTDTGVGMDAETQARIFEPFFTTKEPGKGTGLGLATVYGIVKQSGGNIWVYSEPGRGTTFKVYVPQVLEQPTAEHVEAPVAPIPGGQETVLLVEDEASVRELARESLEMSGYTVLEAQNGGEALLVAEQYGGPIHAILTDVIMPEMSGPELVRRLAGIRPEIRVVYMSGYTGNTIERHGLLDPGTVFLSKPFTPRALATTIRAALDRSVNDAG